VAAASEHLVPGADYQPGKVALTPSMRVYGIAVGEGEDSQGRPVLKVLLLLGR
jgi:hypothetical protein